MSRVHFRQVVRDAFGTVLPGKSVELKVPGEEDQSLMTLYEDSTGSKTLAQPLISDDQGVIEAYVENGRVVDIFVIEDEVTVEDITVARLPSVHGGRWSWNIGQWGAPGVEVNTDANIVEYYLIDRFQIGYVGHQMYRALENWTFDSRIARDDGPSTLADLTVELVWHLNDSSYKDTSFPLTGYSGGPQNAAGAIEVPTTGVTVGTWNNAEDNATFGVNSTGTTKTESDFPKATKGEPCYVELLLKVTTPVNDAWSGLVEFRNVAITSDWHGL